MPNQVTGLVIKDDSLTSEKIGNGEITNTKLAVNAISETALQNDSIDTTAIGTGAGTTEKFAGGAATTEHFQDASVTAIKLAEALFITNGIIMWVGETVPTGWALCDGTNGTPDLRNRFITFNTNSGAGGQDSITLNAAGEHTHTGTTSTTGAHTHTGYTGYHALQANEIPPHRHMCVNTATGSTSEPHANASINRARSYGYDEGYFFSGHGGEPGIGFTSLPVDPNTRGSLGSGSSHRHSITSGGDHNHTLTIASAGVHQHTVDVRPSYIAVKFIMKT